MARIRSFLGLFCVGLLLELVGAQYPFTLLPPPLTKAPSAWTLRGVLDHVPFTSFLTVTPQIDASTNSLVSVSSYQELSFLGLQPLRFEGISYMQNSTYLQALLRNTQPCEIFNEIVNCTDWSYLSGAASPANPLGLWQNNCTIFRFCGIASGTSGTMDIQITTKSNDPSQLIQMTTTTTMEYDGVSQSSALSWTFVRPETPLIPCSTPNATCLCTSTACTGDPLPPKMN